MYGGGMSLKPDHVPEGHLGWSTAQSEVTVLVRVLVKLRRRTGDATARTVTPPTAVRKAAGKACDPT